jgi:serine protease Do
MLATIFKNSKLYLGISIYLLFVFSSIVQASQESSLETLEQTGKTFASIAKEASKAVVGIKAEKNVDIQQYWTIPDWPFNDFFDNGENPLERFFQQQQPDQQRPQNRMQMAQGSGFIISSDGYILTNNHMVSEAEEVTVQLSDDTEIEAEIIGTDPDSDVAVIKIDRDNLPYLELADSDAIEVGEWVLAVGNPFGFSHSVTAGIISAKGRSGVGVATYEDFIQTDAAINPGNSGGPLLNLKGKVIGINTAIISQSGGSLGIGLAIPSNMAKNIYKQLKEEGQVVRGYLGIMIQDLTPELAKSFDMENTDGVLIPDVTKDSAAEKGGIEKGDIVLELNGEDIENADELLNKVAMIKPDTKIKIVVLRDGKRKTLDVKVGERPSRGQIVSQRQPEDSNINTQLGMQVQNLTENLAQRLGYEGLNGVVVTRVSPGSPAELGGIESGMLITEVNRKEVNNVNEFTNAVRRARDEGFILLLVNTVQYSRYITLKFPQD